MRGSEESSELRILVVDDPLDATASLNYPLQVADCKTAVEFGENGAVQVSQL